MHDLIKTFTEADYYKDINLHIHTNFSDGKRSPAEIIKLAQEKGFRFISITDHNTVGAYEHIDAEFLLPAVHEGLKIIAGVEFDCWYGSNFMHILGYGIDVNNGNLKSICAKSKKETELDIIRLFARRSAQDVIKKIKEAGGIAILAHPCCCWNLNIRKMIDELKFFGLDGVEVYYPYVRHRAIVKFHTIAGIKRIAEELDLLMTGGTDCHKDNIVFKG